MLKCGLKGIRKMAGLNFIVYMVGWIAILYFAYLLMRWIGEAIAEWFIWQIDKKARWRRENDE